MHASSPPLLTDLLKQVSRSFYLTLRVLPGAIRPQISLAYLLARASDTIADTALVPAATRLEALRALRQNILGEKPPPLLVAEILRAAPSSRDQNSPTPPLASLAERMLLERLDEALLLLGQFSTFDQQQIRQ